jgi:hypothetical protein
MLTYRIDEQGIRVKFTLGSNLPEAAEVCVGAEIRRVSLPDLTAFCVDMLTILGRSASARLPETNVRLPRFPEPAKLMLRGAALSTEE